MAAYEQHGGDDTHPAHLPAPPSHVTASARAYYRALGRDMRFAGFIGDTVITIDHMPYELERTLDGQPVEHTPGQLARTAPGGRTKFFRKNRQIFLEMVVTRLIDNFQQYLAELVNEVLKKQPSILRASEKSLSLEQVLRFDTMEDLLNDVIERKVSSLSYQGFGDIQAWCRGRGIPLLVSEATIQEVVDFIATRNIIAHNRGRVDKRYLSTVDAKRFSEGETRSLEVGDYWRCAKLLTQIVIDTDAAVAAKFELSWSSFEPTPPEAGILDGRTEGGGEAE